MTENRRIYFIRIVSTTLIVFSIIIFPLLISFSFFLKKRIERAFKTYGRDETFKLINIMGVFGLLTILFTHQKRQIHSKQ